MGFDLIYAQLTRDELTWQKKQDKRFHMAYLIHIRTNMEKQTKDQKTQKTWAGMPVNWDWKNWHKDIWNPEDDQLFPPKRVGIGWGLNLHALLKKMRLLK